MKNKWLIFIIITIVALLCIPLIAMQFTDDVNWTFGDFIMASILFLGTAMICSLVLSKVEKLKWRIMICAALSAVLLLLWTELAVGIFGTVLSGP